MENKKDLGHMTFNLCMLVLGNFLYALSVKLFILPADLVTGGTTGIALTLNHLTGLPISRVVLAFNVCMLLLGWRVLGRAFALTTLGSTFLYPIALELLDSMLGSVTLTQDIMLSTIFAGMGIGLSLGIVIRSGSSTGGMDIPPLVLHRLFRIPVSISLYAFDVLILLSQALYRPAERTLYGILLLLIYTVVLDKLMLMGASKTEVKVVSKKADQIREAILSKIDRGVTMLDGEGGYLHEKTQIIMSVISNQELPKVERIIHSIDPESFMIISRVSEVSGRGFSLKKLYH